MKTLTRPTNDLDKKTAALANELLNAVTTIHKFHLMVTGVGSYAAHKALNEFYDEIGDHADDVVEKYQGAAEKLLDIPDSVPTKVSSVNECVAYLKGLTKLVDEVQSIMPYSELVNILDETKALIDGTKYKLIFLK